VNCTIAFTKLVAQNSRMASVGRMNPALSSSDGASHDRPSVSPQSHAWRVASSRRKRCEQIGLRLPSVWPFIVGFNCTFVSRDQIGTDRVGSGRIGSLTICVFVLQFIDVLNEKNSSRILNICPFRLSIFSGHSECIQ
jgi:hypothetical protein